MKSCSASLALIVATLTLGCDTTPAPVVPAGEKEGGVSGILELPFTAEQIRDEWVPGLRLLIRRSFPEETRIERWTVLSADDEGADIEYATIADDGSVVGEPTIAHSTWIELRDHASFPAALSNREWVARSTRLGEFEGWLYRVEDDGRALVQEFFFVPELPGAPVWMRALEGNVTVFELEQTARLRPETD